MNSLPGAPRLNPITSDRDEVRWNGQARGETEVQRLDRNWGSLVQELRVLQTGVQLLAGFLMIVPFQAGFAELDDGGHVVYFVTVSAAVLAIVFLLAPISMHRFLFRRHRLAVVVTAAHRYVLLGLAMVGVATTGALVMVALAATHSVWAAAGAGASIAVLIAVLWGWIPLRVTRRLTDERSAPPTR
ncbi:hypothetical protein HH308_25690 [Gordonia sp. TBRC 11910]|uniref:Sodium:proton antiporter n=1 Tax=Gordonia asplenii TaxID=2725283 RepID=A0A848L1N0_9ACTN|nr:DUF6328 family protein [Gordonia asplenii]NMO04619.1 hypothetical protein [Gordonia asplenii]